MQLKPLLPDEIKTESVSNVISKPTPTQEVPQVKVVDAEDYEIALAKSSETAVRLGVLPEAFRNNIFLRASVM